MNKQQIYDNSILLIGPEGVGKSFISSQLRSKLKMPVVTTDLLKHCPMDLKEIDKKRASIVKTIRILEAKEKTYSEENVEKIRRLQQIIKSYKIDNYTLKKQHDLREKFPDIPNFGKLGYDKMIALYLKVHYGNDALMFYEKQFEIKQLKLILESLKEPSIVKIESGSVIYFNDKFKDIENKLKNKDTKIYDLFFDKDYLGFDKIENILNPFEKRIYLKMPKNTPSYLISKKAKSSKLNSEYVATGQYDLLSNYTVLVSNLFYSGTVNNRELKIIIDTIMKIYQGKAQSFKL